MLFNLKAFWEICILQRAPQDLPSSRGLMYVSLLAYFAISLISGWLQLPPPIPLPAALLDTALLVVFIRAMLWVRTLDARFVQTLTAMAGAGALMGLVVLPLLYWQQQSGGGTEAGFTLPAFLLLLWLAWSVVVIGNVLRHALSTLFFIGIALAVIYMHFSFQLMRFLFLATTNSN